MQKTRIDIFGWSLLILILGLTLLVIGMFPLRLNGDVAVYVDLGGRLLDGDLPYVDFFDVATPTMYYLNVLPNLLARATPINPITWFLLQTLVITGLSSVVIWHLGKVWFEDDDKSPYLWILPLGVAMFSLALAVYRYGDYAQRGHYALLLYLPALLVRVRSWQGVKTNIYLAGVLGFFAAMGISIKPYYVLLPLLTEVYFLLRYRRWQALWSVEVWGFTTFSIIFLAYFLLNPAILNGALYHFGLFDEYLEIQYPLSTFLERSRLQVNVLLIVACVMALWWSREERHLQVFEAVGILGIAGFLILTIQAKNFSYHWIFLDIMAWLSAAFLVVWGSMRTQIKRPILAYVVFTTFIIGYVAQKLPHITTNGSSLIRELVTNYDASSEGLMMITQDVMVSYPALVQVEANHVTSFIQAPIFFDDSWRGEESSDYLQTYYQITRADILEEQPRLIYIKTLELDVLTREGLIQDTILPDYAVMHQTSNDIAFLRVDDMPLQDGFNIADTFRLRRWNFSQDVGACTTFELETVWQPLQIDPTFYSMTLVVVGDNGSIVQDDGTPSGVETPTWQIGWSYYDDRSVEIPCELPTGSYNVLLALYDPTDTSNNAVIGNYIWLTEFSVP